METLKNYDTKLYSNNFEIDYWIKEEGKQRSGANEKRNGFH